MTTFDIVVGVLSITLGLVAIFVSWKLYQMSEGSAERMRRSEEVIAQHVRELDRIYGLLYSDTWSLVRDTYTTMQERMWKSVAAPNSRTVDDPVTTAEPPADTTSVSILTTPPADTEDDAESTDNLNDFLVESYERLSARGARVRAQELIAIAERLGYPFDDALNALHNVVFVEKRLHLASKRFSPFALVADTAEKAAELQDLAADEAMDELSRESPQG